ncbi:MAG: DUF308 domain-containing protein, partial [Bacillota bacterium]|nr:DUF308 domain-containing protein [Bacillota bacterium]
TIVSGVLMAAAGAFCFMNYGQTFLNMAFVIGAVMVFCGIVHGLAYLIGREEGDKKDNNGWILINSLLTLLFGILVLCNQLTVDLTIPMFFGMWVLVTGLLRLEAASRIDVRNKPRNFKSVLITGIASTLIGLFGMINPLATYVSMIGLVGIFLIMEGINAVELGINMPHKKKEQFEIKKRERKAVKIND